MREIDDLRMQRPNLTVLLDTTGRSNNPMDNIGYIIDKPLYSISIYFRPQPLGQSPGFD